MNDIADALTQQVGFSLRGRNPDVLRCGFPRPSVPSARASR